MKRIISIVLAILLLGSVSFAETSEAREMTSEEQAYNIYLDIAYVYDYGVRYLEEMERIWEIALSAEDVDAVNNLSYMDCFPQVQMFSLISLLTDKYGYSENELKQLSFSNDVFSVTEKTDLVWAVLALEEESGYLKNPSVLKVYLDRAFGNIRTLMAADKEYALLSELKDYYKDAVLLYEYIADFKDNYTGFSEKLDEFKRSKSSWEVDFEFLFDPSGYSYVREIRAAQQDEENKRNYDRALVYENEGDYRNARDYYWLCKGYEDAFDRMSSCTEKINAEITVEKAAAEAEAARVAAEKTAMTMRELLHTGVSFDTPKNEFAAILNNNGIETKEYSKFIRAKSGLFKSASTEYYFKDENSPQQLTSVHTNLYGNTSASTASSTYQTALQQLLSVCGTPYATNSNSSRPTYNELKGNTASLISGPAYKDSDFDGKIVNFSEWLFDAGEYYINVIVYNKHFPAHKFYEVTVLYEVVSYTAVK